MDPVLAIALAHAVDRTRAHAHSALPDAPVLTDPPAPVRSTVTGAIRLRLAAGLHRLASALEPRSLPGPCLPPGPSPRHGPRGTAA